MIYRTARKMPLTGLLFLFGVLVAAAGAQTCPFGSLTLEVGHTVCNVTSGRLEVCSQNGAMLSFDRECRDTPQLCALLTGTNPSSDGSDTTFVGVHQTVCLQGNVQRCAVLYRRIETTAPFPVRRGWFRRRIVRRYIYIRVTVLRNSSRPCPEDGCFLPYVNQTVLPLNETRCVKGVVKFCDADFILKRDGLCSCRVGHKLVLEGETVCNRRLGLLNICARDGDMFSLQPNGTCEVQCCYHGTCFSVNHTVCSRGKRFVCGDNGRFQRQGPCHCLFDGTLHQPFSTWCDGARRYKCGGYGQFRAIGYCSCEHDGRTHPVGSTWCNNYIKFICRRNGNYYRIGSCPRQCQWQGEPVAVGTVICSRRRRRICRRSGRWQTIGYCRRRPWWGRGKK